MKIFPPVLKRFSYLATVFFISSAALTHAQNTDNKAMSFDQRHHACLEAIADDPDTAYEDALIWRDEGGGRRAKHCVAMALFALGHPEEAAHRLDKLAASPQGGSDEMRVDYYAEAANFWLASTEYENAYASATAGLDLDPEDHALRISRARAYAALGRYDYATTDLSSVLAFAPDHIAALRYRAYAYLNQDMLDEAKTDIERALDLDPTDIDTALLRGRINEARRVAQDTPL